MNSSPVLRQQSPNKIRSDFMRTKNEHNKMPVHPKPPKLLSTLHLSDQNIENRDPGNAEMGRKAPVRPGVSRLPVLAKSLRLQTPSDFGQSHCRWEEKPLAGKTKKKKPCTRPVPFNLSQPKSSRAAAENQPPVNAQSRTGAENSEYHPNTNAQSTKHPAPFSRSLDSTKAPATSNAKAAQHAFHLAGQSAPSSALKASATFSNPLSSAPHKAVSQSSAAAGAQACLDNMSLLSLKDPTKASGQSTQQGNLSRGSGDKSESFQPDHAALLSVLRNEGAGAAGLGSTTPHSKALNYLPQRVPVTKSRQKAAATAGSGRSAHFSPDAAALQSILQNKGVRDGGPVGATLRNSTCPSGRGTSIYAAQRVPLRKNPAGGAAALKETPQKTWTPQRVPNTRHRPMSSMKCFRSTPQSLCSVTPGLRSFKTNIQPHQEEIVQRLFDDQDDEQSTNVTDKRAEQILDQATAPHGEEKVEGSSVSGGENEEEEEEEEEQQWTMGVQPFIQAAQRESVIFFSTGKTLLRAPRFEKQESSARQEQPGPVLPGHTSTGPIQPADSLHRELLVQKPCALSPAVALLRKRLPPLEELLMDEEVASYTSASVPAALGFLPPRPRCGNPLASILHFEESSKFVPIVFDVSPGSSPRQER